MRRLLLMLLGLVLAGGIADAKDRAPTKTPTITGQVFANGQPVKRTIEVRVAPERPDSSPAQGAALRTVTTSDDGTFRLEGLKPAYYELRTLRQDGSFVLDYVNVPKSLGTIPVRLTMLLGSQTLQGRVCWADGSPFRGWISVLEESTLLAPVDEEGRFEITRLPEGRRNIGVESKTFTCFLRAVDLPLAEPLELLADEFLGNQVEHFEGRIVDERGEPIAEATVHTSVFFGQRQSTTTDAAGVYSVLLGEGQSFSVRKTGYCPSEFDAKTALANSGTTVLRDYRTLSGVVTGPDGPVAGVPVIAVPNETRKLGTLVKSDEAGRFYFDKLPPETVQVIAFGNGWLTASGAKLQPVTADLSKPASEVVLEVSRSAQLTGTIQNAPLPTTVAVYGLLPREMLAPGAGEPFRTLVDEAGSWTLEVVPDASVQVSARTPTRNAAMANVMAPSPGAQREVELAFPTSRTVTVRLRDATSKAPIHDARVLIYPKSWPGWFVRGHWTTGADGSVRIPRCPNGGYTVDVTAPGYLSEDDYTWKHPEPTVHTKQDITIDLPRAGRIEGRLEGPAGLGARTIKIHVRGTPREIGNVTHHGGGGKHVYARVGQSFRARTLEPGEYRLKASTTFDGHRWRVEQVVDTDQKSVVLRLEKRARVEARTVALVDAQRQPVSYADVRFHHRAQGGGIRKLAETQVRAGKIPWTIDLKRHVVWLAITGAKTGDVAKGAGLFGPYPANKPPKSIQLKRALTVRGSVKTADGKGVAGVRVTARPAWRDGTSRIYYEKTAKAKTAADGTFDLAGLSPDEHAIEFSYPREFGAIPTRMIHPLGISDLEVVVQPTAPVTLRVVTTAGEPVSDATIIISTGEPGTTGYWVVDTPDTDAQGVATVTRLVAGQAYRLRVWPDREQRAQFNDFDEPKWIAADTVVTLPNSTGISGQIVDDQGQPVASIPVGLRSVNDRSTHIRFTDEDGKFVYPEPPTGAIEVGLAINTASYLGRGWIRVNPSVENKPVRLVLDTKSMLFVRWPGTRGKVVFTPRVRVVDSDTDKVVADMRDMSTNGRVFLQGLKPNNRYVVLAGPLEDGRVAFAEGVRTGATPLPLKWRPGQTIRGEVRKPTKMRPMRKVWATWKGFTVESDIDADGRFELKDLPPGTTWTLQCVVDGASMIQMAKATATVGADNVVLGE